MLSVWQVSSARHLCFGFGFFNIVVEQQKIKDMGEKKKEKVKKLNS